jgi:predicted RNA-binding Zn ribbon-like protein
VTSHLVDGVPLPDQVAGHAGLELCNTRAGWGTASPREYLTDDRALVAWAVDAGLLGGAPARRVAAEVTAITTRSHAVRQALYACALGRGNSRDWDVIGRAVTDARVGALLRPGPGGAAAGWDLRAVADADPALAALHAAALAAEDLLRSPLAGAVAACPGEGCGWLFADPRGRRRWCSMAVCGNRAKARRHAERRARPPGA